MQQTETIFNERGMGLQRGQQACEHRLLGARSVLPANFKDHAGVGGSCQVINTLTDFVKVFRQWPRNIVTCTISRHSIFEV
jgi:hypothetical protein